MGLFPSLKCAFFLAIKLMMMMWPLMALYGVQIVDAREARGWTCSGMEVLKQDSGSFTDGTEPWEYYNAPKNCTWHIKPDQQYSEVDGIVLVFKRFQLAMSDDYLLVKSGDGEALALYTGDLVTPTAARFDASELVVTFVAFDIMGINAYDGGKGFDIEYMINREDKEPTCYNRCAGSSKSFGVCTEAGLCACPRGLMGADCSIEVPLVKADEVVQAQVPPSETKYYEFQAPAGISGLLIELTVDDETKMENAKPVLLLGNGTASSSEVPILDYYQESTMGCGDFLGCAWSPVNNVQQSLQPQVEYAEPVVYYDTSGPAILRRDPPAFPIFPFGTVCLPSLPSYNFYSVKDYEASATKMDYHHIYLPAISKDGSTLLTAGRWMIGVMNQPTYKGNPGGVDNLIFELKVRVLTDQGESPLCPLGCSNKGVCVQDSPQELGKCVCEESYTGIACDKPVVELVPGRVSKIRTLPIGSWDYYILNVPVSKLSQELYVETEYMTPSADEVLVVLGSKEIDWNRIVFPKAEVNCINSPYGSGPSGFIQCDIEGFNSTYVKQSQAMQFDNNNSQGHLGLLIPPEEHVVYDNVSDTYWPTNKYVIGVYNSPEVSSAPVQYKIMASWYPESGIAPCPFNCNDRGECNVKNSTCKCSMPAYVGLTCNDKAIPIAANGGKYSGSIPVGDDMHFYLNVDKKQNILIEMEHTTENAFPLLSVGKGNVPSLITDESIVWHDDQSYWCTGIECASKNNHGLHFEASPGLYYITVENTGYRLYGYFREIYLSRDTLDRYNESLAFTLDVKTFDEDENKQCYQNCSGNGYCRSPPICTCKTGYFGMDCSIAPRKLATGIVNVNEPGGGYIIPVTDTVQAGHFKYYALRLPHKAKSFLVTLRSNTRGQDYETDITIVARKNALPRLCVHRDETCTNAFDAVSTSFKSLGKINAMSHTLKVVTDDLNGTTDRKDNHDFSDHDVWYVAVYHGFTTLDDFTYKFMTFYSPRIVCEDPNCDGHGTCDTKTGQCNCFAGYVGNSCEFPVYELTPNAEMSFDNRIESGTSLFLKTPINCTAQDFSLNFESNSPLHHLITFTKRGGYPRATIDSYFDVLSTGDEGIEIYDAQPGIWYTELAIPMDAPLSVSGLKVLWTVQPTRMADAEYNDCKYSDGTLFISAEAAKGPFKVLSVNDGKVAFASRNSPMEWAYNQNDKLQESLPAVQTRDGSIAEASYGNCGSNGKSCYFQSMNGKVGVGMVSGGIALARSTVDNSQQPFFYLKDLLFKFPGDHENDFSKSEEEYGILSTLPLHYQYNGNGNGWDYEACSPLLNEVDMRGKVCMVARGSCTFLQKTKNCQDAGAIAVIIVDTSLPITWSPVPVAAPGGADTLGINIPTVSIGSFMATKILAMLDGDNTGYSNNVVMKIGSYNCSSRNVDGKCASCGNYTYGEICEIQCPGIADDYSSACSGHGKCKYKEGVAVCKCKKKHGGPDCSIKLAHESEDELMEINVNKKIVGVFFGTLFAVILISLLVIVGVWYYMKKKRKRGNFFKMEEKVPRPETPGTSMNFSTEDTSPSEEFQSFKSDQYKTDKNLTEVELGQETDKKLAEIDLVSLSRE